MAAGLASSAAIAQMQGYQLAQPGSTMSSPRIFVKESSTIYFSKVDNGYIISMGDNTRLVTDPEDLAAQIAALIVSQHL